MLKKALIFSLALVPAMVFPQGVKDDAAVKKMKGMRADAYTLLDVRSAEAAQEGMLPRALNIPMGSLAKSLKQIDKTKHVFVYDAGDGQAAKAVDALLKKKYAAYNIGAYNDLKAPPPPAPTPVKQPPAKKK